MKGKSKQQTRGSATKNPGHFAPYESAVRSKIHNNLHKDVELKTHKLSDVAYERIKEAIILCDLAPGQGITEAQLDSHFSLGKASIRSALVRLAQEGLVQAIPQRGYIIVPLTIQDIENLFELRLLLETASARKAAGRLDPERVQRLADLCKMGYIPGDLESRKVFLRANRSFHVIIAQASGNDKLVNVIENVLDEMTRVIYLGMSLSDSSEKWKHGHKETLEALVHGGAKEADRIMRMEIESAREKILLAVMRSPTVKQVNLIPGNLDEPGNNSEGKK